MPNPFPGMNPYLECSANWRNFQPLFVAFLASEINRQLPRERAATIEARSYRSWESRHREAFIEIRAAQGEREVIAVSNSSARQQTRRVGGVGGVSAETARPVALRNSSDRD